LYVAPSAARGSGLDGCGLGAFIGCCAELAIEISLDIVSLHVLCYVLLVLPNVYIGSTNKNLIKKAAQGTAYKKRATNAII
jgi:hypothetical protein